MRRTYRCMEIATITCYQSTWSHLVDQKALETSLVCFRIGLRSGSQFFFVKFGFFIKLEIMFDFTNLRISYPCYLCLFVCNFAVKLAFVPSLLQ